MARKAGNDVQTEPAKHVIDRCACTAPAQRNPEGDKTVAIYPRPRSVAIPVPFHCPFAVAVPTLSKCRVRPTCPVVRVHVSDFHYFRYFRVSLVVFFSLIGRHMEKEGLSDRTGSIRTEREKRRQ